MGSEVLSSSRLSFHRPSPLGSLCRVGCLSSHIGESPSHPRHRLPPRVNFLFRSLVSEFRPWLLLFRHSPRRGGPMSIRPTMRMRWTKERGFGAEHVQTKQNTSNEKESFFSGMGRVFSPRDSTHLAEAWVGRSSREGGLLLRLFSIPLLLVGTRPILDRSDPGDSGVAIRAPTPMCVVVVCSRV